MANLIKVLEESEKTFHPVIKEILELNVEKKYYPWLSIDSKMICATLTLLSVRALGGTKKNALYPGAAVEMLSCYTSSDHVFAASAIFQAGSRTAHPVLITQILAKTLKKLAEADIDDQLMSGKLSKDENVKKNKIAEIKEGDCLKMIEKRATLYESCCEIGALCAKASPQKIKALKEYGYNLGMAWLIREDVKNYKKDVIKKRNGNIVLVVKEEKANKMITSYIKKAQDSISKAPQNQWTRAMSEITTYENNY